MKLYCPGCGKEVRLYQSKYDTDRLRYCQHDRYYKGDKCPNADRCLERIREMATATMTETQTPLTETWKDVEHMIRRVCSNFVRKHGGDYDEYYGVAQLVFLDVCNIYDSSKGQFSTILWTSIWRRLITYNLRETQFANVRRQSPQICDRGSAKRMELVEIQADPTVEDDLSDDANFIVRLVLDMPEELEWALGFKRPSAWSGMIWAYLADLGWSAKRIAESFREIRETL